VGIEVGFFTQSAPELTVRAVVQRAGWQFQLEATRSLEPEPSVRFSFLEQVKQPNWQATLEVSWEPSGYAISLKAEAHETFGQVGMGIQATAGETHWSFLGALQGEGWHLQFGSIELQQDNLLLINAMALTWVPEPDLTVKARLDRSKPLPGQLEVEWAFAQDAHVNGVGRFAGGSESAWSWQETELSLSGQRESLKIITTNTAWQMLWIEGTQELWQGGDLRGRLRLGPSGWQGTELEAAWRDPFSNSLRANLALSPEGWKAQTEVSWLDPNLSVQGKMNLAPQGLDDLMLLGRATYDAFLLDGLFKYTSRSWLLDLSGNLSQEEGWQWGGTTSWTSLVGWEKASVSVGREWSF